MEVSWNLAALLLFVLETYHVLAHLAVLLRVRLLPRKDLVRVRLYFLVDGMTSFVTAFLYTGQLRWLVSLHVIQHLYYYFFWEKSHWAKRIVDWSSLDWFQSSVAGQVEMDNILGTLFDIVVHLSNLYILSTYLSVIPMVVAVILSCLSITTILFNPRFAWSNPSSPLRPWIKKRIGPLASQR